MRNKEILILQHEDLIYHSKNKSIFDITLKDFKLSPTLSKSYRESSFVLFIDSDRNNKVLKNRFREYLPIKHLEYEFDVDTLIETFSNRLKCEMMELLGYHLDNGNWIKIIGN